MKELRDRLKAIEFGTDETDKPVLLLHMPNELKQILEIVEDYIGERERMYKRNVHDRLEVTANMLFNSYEKLADLEKDLEGKYI